MLILAPLLKLRVPAPRPKLFIGVGKWGLVYSLLRCLGCLLWNSYDVLLSQNHEIYRDELMKNGVEGWGGVHRGSPHPPPKKRFQKRSLPLLPPPL